MILGWRLPAVWPCNGAVTNLCSVTQACCCSKVQFEGSSTMRAHICCRHLKSRVLAATTSHLEVCPATEPSFETFRLIELACDCSTVRGGSGLKVHARLCRWHSNQAPAGLCLCEGAAIGNAPTDRAHLQLLHSARRMRTQGTCSSLPLALQPGTCRSLPL